MHPCHRCRRHIKRERNCPFCGAPAVLPTTRAAVLIATGLALQPERCAQPQPLPIEACAKSAEECRIDDLYSAFALAPEPRFLLEIATLNEKIDRPAEALKAYTRYRRACQDAPSIACTDVTDPMARLKSSTSALQIRLYGTTTRIEVDGAIVDPAELVDPIYVMPGRHRVQVTWERGMVVEQTLVLEAGGSGLVSLISPDAAGQRAEPLYGIAVRPSGCACEVVPSEGGLAERPAGGLLVLGAAALVERRRRRPADAQRPNRRRPRLK